jgi:hypothetical protein
MKFEDFFIKSCNISEKYFKFLIKEPRYSNEFKESIDFLEWNITPASVIIFSRLVMLISFLFFIAITIFSILNKGSVTIFLICTVIIPLLLAHFITEYPKTQANIERLKDIGYAPEILIQLIISLRQNLNLEEAFRFSSKFGEGRIAKEIKKALWYCWTGKKSSLKEQLLVIADKWGYYSSGLKRSLYLIRSSFSERNKERRDKILDKAIDSMLNSIITEMRTFSMNLYMPTLILFTIGTVFPLIIISLLPMFSFVWNTPYSSLQILILLFFSILVTFIYSNYILAKKPAGFSSINIPNEIEGFPRQGNIKILNKEFPAIPYLFLLFIFFSIPGILFIITKITGFELKFKFFTGFPSLTIIFSLTLVICLYYHGTMAYKKKIKDVNEQIESEILDAMYHIASRISEGRSPEEAITYVSRILRGTRISAIFEKVSWLMKNRNLTLEQAFFDERMGVINEIHSKRVISIFRIFVDACKKGSKNAAEVLFTISNYFSELKKNEEEMRKTLTQSIQMMRATAIFFSPVICALVISLQKTIQTNLINLQQRFYTSQFLPLEMPFIKAPMIDIEFVYLFVGIYMLLLSITLIRFVSYIEHNKNEIEFGLDVSKNLLTAFFIFLITLIISNMIIT